MAVCPLMGRLRSASRSSLLNLEKHYSWFFKLAKPLFLFSANGGCKGDLIRFLQITRDGL